MATIFDVAKQAGVAPSTVSLVANGKSRVSGTTRRRVEAVMQQLGYRPRVSQGRQRLGLIGQFGVIYVLGKAQHHGMSELAREYVEGVAEVLAREGAGVSLIGVQGALEDDPMLQTGLRVGQLGGLVLTGVDPAERSNARFLDSLGLPVVAVNRHPRHAEFSAACADYYRGGRAAVAHLAKHGHQRLAFVGLSRRHSPTRERYRGVRDELRERGLPAAATFMALEWRGMTERETVIRFCLEQVASGVTGLMMGDGDAVHVAEALAQAGRRVPRDVSIVGCDGRNVRVDPGLRLTTLDFDQQRLGELAGQTLLELVRSESQLTSVVRVVPMELVEGQTVASPRNL